jgi:DNA-binding response OmpR family regulator
VQDILIVDQDPVHLNQTARYLSLNGYIVRTAADAKAMNRILAREPVGLLILDSQLPEGAGLATCRRLAEAGGPPVIMLGEGRDEVERIIGLEVGADDFISKEIHPRELLARVRVAARRSAAVTKSKPPPSYASRGFQLDGFRLQLRAPDGAVLRLTPTEAAILTVFLEHRGEPVTRIELKELALRDDREVHDRAVDTQVSRLRRKLNAYSGADLIKTVYGVGYVWDSGYGLTGAGPERDVAPEKPDASLSIGAI